MSKKPHAAKSPVPPKTADGIVQDGFLLREVRDNLKDVALLSLRVALRAYFSTYEAMSYALHLFDPGRQEDQSVVDFNHSTAYCEASTEAILHFQHFIELFCKDVLRADHPLLAADASSDAVLLHRLLHQEQLQDDEMKNLRSLEFSDSLRRLTALIHDGRIDQNTYGFVYDSRLWLDQLNVLRNRAWHRGAFVLRYPSLDQLVGRFILPFVTRVTALPAFQGKEGFWRYRSLACKVDPVTEIMKAIGEDPIDTGKVAFFKELGRAAYENPYHESGFAKHFNNEIRGRAERAAQAELGDANISDVRECPVCGSKCLVVYDDIEGEGEDPADGTYDKAWRYTWQVQCRVCSFLINNHLKNPSAYGLTIADYWVAEKL